MLSFLFLFSVASAQYSKHVLIDGINLRGTQGVGISPTDGFLWCSLVGQAIHKVDLATGTVSDFIPAPFGEADDLAIASDGTVYYTSMFEGIWHARRPNGDIVSLNGGGGPIPGANPIALHPDGRLFGATIFLGDSLYQIDPTGATAPVLLGSGWGGLNGFQFHPVSGVLYAPSWFTQQILAINVDASPVTNTTVATVSGVCTACKFRPGDNTKVYCSQTRFAPNIVSDILEIDLSTTLPNGQHPWTTLVSSYPKGVDNFIFDNNGNLYVSFGTNTLVQFNATTGAFIRIVFTESLSTTGGIAIANSSGQADTVYIADFFRGVTVSVDKSTWSATASDVPVGDPSHLFPEGFLPIEYSVSHVGNKYLLTNTFIQAVAVIDDQTYAVTESLFGWSFPLSSTLRARDGLVITADFGLGAVVTGAFITTPVCTGLAGPASVAVNPRDDNFVLVSEYFSGLITSCDLRNGNKTVIASGLSNPKGLTVQNDNGQRYSIYVVEGSGSNRLIRYQSPNNNNQAWTETTIDYLLPVATTSINSGILPIGLLAQPAVANDGTVYVTINQGRNGLVAYSPN